MDIRFDEVSLRQGDFLLRADLTIRSGKNTAIIGPSGGGKSTLLMTLAGYFTPDSGRILFGGRDVTDQRPADRPVTMLFQEHNLFPHLTVFQNTALGVRPNLRLSPDEVARVEAALAEVGLADMGPRYPEALSGGQRQRVALARALLRDRPVLLLDEPFAALGPGLRYEMLDLVAGLAARRNATVVMVSHNPDDASRIAAQTVLMFDGLASGPFATSELLAAPPEALRRYLGL